jgi:hypothetical protein
VRGAAPDLQKDTAACAAIDRAFANARERRAATMAFGFG